MFFDACNERLPNRYEIFVLLHFCLDAVRVENQDIEKGDVGQDGVNRGLFQTAIREGHT